MLTNQCSFVASSYINNRRPVLLKDYIVKINDIRGEFPCPLSFVWILVVNFCNLNDLRDCSDQLFRQLLYRRHAPLADINSNLFYDRLKTLNFWYCCTNNAIHFRSSSYGYEALILTTNSPLVVKTFLYFISRI